MATSNSPLVPDPDTSTNLDLIPLPDPPEEDLGAAVPVGEEGNIEPVDESKDSMSSGT